jgi:hypothetical protein
MKFDQRGGRQADAGAIASKSTASKSTHIRSNNNETRLSLTQTLLRVDARERALQIFRALFKRVHSSSDNSGIPNSGDDHTRHHLNPTRK